jgi:hypothetical protein
LAMIPMRLDDHVSDGPFRRIDDDVGELTEWPVSAVDGGYLVQAHDLHLRSPSADATQQYRRWPWAQDSRRRIRTMRLAGRALK